MNDDFRTSMTLAVLTAGFAVLAIALYRIPAQPALTPRPPFTQPQSLAGVTPPGTIRISASQLVTSGGDASGLACYTCHDQKKPPVVKYDANHQVILPKEHADLIISMRNCAECHSPADPVKLEYTADGSVVIPEAHRNLASMSHGRNENCYTCHEQNHLDRLHTPEGAELKFEEATLLCAGCHGPNYRDWNAGIHGRTSGYWDRKAGPITRQECTSCHDPHSPRFTGIIPMPGPTRSNRAPLPPASAAKSD